MLGKDLPPSQLYSLDSQFHQNKIYVHCKYIDLEYEPWKCM